MTQLIVIFITFLKTKGILTRLKRTGSEIAFLFKITFQTIMMKAGWNRQKILLNHSNNVFNIQTDNVFSTLHQRYILAQIFVFSKNRMNGNSLVQYKYHCGWVAKAQTCECADNMGKKLHITSTKDAALNLSINAEKSKLCC